jgi:HTH-type transcriptional regulator/antitoxin HigA
MSALAEDLEQYWTAIRPILCIRNEREYDQAVKRLNRLIDEIGTNEQHPLYELLSTWA